MTSCCQQKRSFKGSLLGLLWSSVLTVLPVLSHNIGYVTCPPPSFRFFYCNKNHLDLVQLENRHYNWKLNVAAQCSVLNDRCASQIRFHLSREESESSWLTRRGETDKTMVEDLSFETKYKSACFAMFWILKSLLTFAVYLRWFWKFFFKHLFLIYWVPHCLLILCNWFILHQGLCRASKLSYYFC